MSYYNHYGVECFDLIKLFLKPANQEEGFYLGNVIKYVYRAGIKDVENEITDIDKALDYFDRFLKLVTNPYNGNRFNDGFRVDLSYTDFITFVNCFENMPLYKKDFFLCLLYCAFTGKWEGLKVIYKTLKSYRSKELEG